MQPFVLGIDIGTGSTKAVAVGYNGQLLNTAQYYYPVKNPQPGYAEQDPKLIFEAFKNCILEITSKIGAPTAIGLSSAMHSLLPVDSAGNALADMMIWADARSQQIAEHLRASAAGIEIYTTSGTPIHAMTPLCKLIWLKENEPDLFKRSFKFISIKEYIWFQLFNDFQVDYSIASATGLFNIETFKWNAKACQLAGVETNKLSVPVTTLCQRADLNPTFTEHLQLAANTPFIIGASDGCCANLGSYVTKPHIAALTIGTSGAVRVTTANPVINTNAMIFNYLLNNQTFVSGGAVNNGGSAVKWLIKTFLNTENPGENDYQAFFSEAAIAAPGANGLTFLPYLNGERAPIWDTGAGGVFFNMRQHHNRSHFLRAGLEGICFALNNVLHTLEQSVGTIDTLHVSGGFINSKLWLQVLADVTGKPLIIVQHEDASALGAAFLAASALSLPGSISNPLTANQEIIKPNADNYQIYKQRFQVFKKLYAQLKDLMQEDSVV